MLFLHAKLVGVLNNYKAKKRQKIHLIENWEHTVINVKRRKKIGRTASSQVNDLVIALPYAPRYKWKIICLLTAIDLPGAGQV